MLCSFIFCNNSSNLFCRVFTSMYVVLVLRIKTHFFIVQVFGIDAVPVTLNDNQYPDFFRVCNEYARVWKSKNTTSVEMLFLQLLSYYVKTFNTKQFVVSIQTRMPVIKADKNWHSRKLLVEGRFISQITISNISNE